MHTQTSQSGAIISADKSVDITRRRRKLTLSGI